ncbi:MAG: hypothetical protein JOZ10_00630 [Acidobacteria bacterium]|nr:hypothetical protein [Acidobacteriota bacterium]MBV9146829.1 hypothetical protein [Acidobacteriota bacterium]
MSANPIYNESSFAEAALEHWRRLGEELRTDVDAFNRQKGGAAFSESGEQEYRVSNSGSGLELRIYVDPEDHLAHYEFRRTNDHSAGAPEGGILSMRMGQSGVEFYSSDQPLTAEEARRLLLDPVLQPPSV